MTEEKFQISWEQVDRWMRRDRQARYFLKKLIEARKALFALGWYEEDEQILPPTEFVFEPKRGK